MDFTQSQSQNARTPRSRNLTTHVKANKLDIYHDLDVLISVSSLTLLSLILSWFSNLSFSHWAREMGKKRRVVEIDNEFVVDISKNAEENVEADEEKRRSSKRARRRARSRKRRGEPLGEVTGKEWREEIRKGGESEGSEVGLGDLVGKRQERVGRLFSVFHLYLWFQLARRKILMMPALRT